MIKAIFFQKIRYSFFFFNATLPTIDKKKTTSSSVYFSINFFMEEKD
jgi:hypothetical protein